MYIYLLIPTPPLKGKNNVYILFPDHGAYDRYAEAVEQELFLDLDHILQLAALRNDVLCFCQYTLRGLTRLLCLFWFYRGG